MKPEDFIEIVDYNPVKKIFLSIGPNNPDFNMTFHWLVQNARKEINILVQLKSNLLINKIINNNFKNEKQIKENSIEIVKDILIKLRKNNSIYLENYGIFVIGTVAGDLHDIGKNLVSMMVEGNGWEVVDLGTDVSAEKFVNAIKAHPGCHVGLSALLTTTMVNMEQILKDVKAVSPGTMVLIGGAPVSEDFKDKIGADFYSPDPQGAVEYLNSLVA
jgi:methanogenic corrinoid protein MtbC1